MNNKNNIIKTEIFNYITELGKLTENFTNNIHILDREWDIWEEEKEVYLELLASSGYFSQDIKDKNDWSGFKDNLDILKLVYNSMNSSDYLEWLENNDLE